MGIINIYIFKKNEVVTSVREKQGDFNTADAVKIFSGWKKR